ncbi:winged helix-turn-helix transcriptional regulator [Candidatus Roizmanbacteria bacterium]|nr:winged helix-turn-helix transcriptional regulator [Candidatus Roizmanbacteria bacterium]
MKRKELFENIAKSFELLGNPLRLQIFLKILSEGCDCDIDTQKGFTGNCVTGVMKDLKIPQSTASSYIKDLERGGLIECKKNGKYVYCRPKRETLLSLKSFIDTGISQLRYK